MIDRLLRWLWLSLLTAMGVSRANKAATDNQADWVAARPLHNTEKYWLFTPLQRMYCISATVDPAIGSRLTKERLVVALLQVVTTPGFFNLVCTLSHPHSESEAQWSAPNTIETLRQLVQRSITVVGDGTMNDAMERELATDFDLSDSTVALWRLVVLPDSGGLVWTFQHILGDGVGARDSMQRLMQHLSEETIAHNWSEPFIPPPVTGAVEFLLPSTPSVSSWIVAIKRLLSSQPKFFSGRVIHELAPSAMSTQVHIEQLSGAQLMKAREKARSRDVTMHGLIVAASASALRLVFQPGATPCNFLTPINLRPWMSRDYQHSVGNLFTAYNDNHFCSTTNDGDWQFARHYMTTLKQSVMNEYHAQSILSWLAIRIGMAKALTSSVAKLHNLRKGTVEISNLGVVDSMPNCSTMAFTGRVHNDGPLLLLGPVSVNGGLSLSLSFCSPLVSREEAQLYVTEMIRFMTETGCSSEKACVPHSSSSPCSLLQLPAVLITSTLLPFLDFGTKLRHLSHLCRSFPALTSASFRHDHVVLDVAAAEHLTSLGSSSSAPSLSGVLVTVPTLWLDIATWTVARKRLATGRSHTLTGDEEAIFERERATVISSYVCCLSIFSALTALHLALPHVHFGHAAGRTFLVSLCIRALSSSLQSGAGRGGKSSARQRGTGCARRPGCAATASAAVIDAAYYVRHRRGRRDHPRVAVPTVTHSAELA